jgi:hypothetical protein
MYVYRNSLFLNNGLSYSLPHDFPRLCDVDAMPHDTRTLSKPILRSRSYCASEDSEGWPVGFSCFL